MARAALAATAGSPGMATPASIGPSATARFYADHNVLARAPGLATTVMEGAEGALAIEDDQL